MFVEREDSYGKRLVNMNTGVCLEFTIHPYSITSPNQGAVSVGKTANLFSGNKEEAFRIYEQIKEEWIKEANSSKVLKIT